MAGDRRVSLESGIGALAGAAFAAGFAIVEVAMGLVMVYFVGVALIKRFMRP
jgi:hypothetical protein